MFAFIVVLIFILFFVLIMVVKDEKLLLKIAKVFLIIVLGGLVVAGSLAILTGIYETLHGESDTKQLFIQMGAGIIFIAGGGFPLYLFFISREVAIKRLERRKKKYPDAPWMWVDQWSTKSIVYSGKGQISFGWFVLMVMTASLAAVSYVNREKILSKVEESALEVIAFYSIFCFILFIGFYAVVSLLRGYLKFGKSIFEMTSYPGIIGGELTGTIQTQMKNIPEKGFDLELQCGLIDLTSKPGNRLRNTHNPVSLWEAEKKVRFEEANIGPQGVSIPVSFSIPADARESDAWSWDKRIVWTLSAFSSLEGAGYLSKFDIPVFKTRSKP